MKNLLILTVLFYFGFCNAQETVQDADFSKFKNQSEIIKIEVETSEGEFFTYNIGRMVSSTKEIQKIFGIPDTLAGKYPWQVMFLKEFTNMEAIAPDDIIGISTFSINPERIRHQFFENGKMGLEKSTRYAATFNNSLFCSFYGNIFLLEIHKGQYLNNNPAYFLIFNEDVPYKEKTEEARFVSEGYFALLGLPDSKNPVFLDLEKRAEALGFKFKRVEEKQDISAP